jgi:hypothetical protein
VPYLQTPAAQEEGWPDGFSTAVLGIIGQQSGRELLEGCQFDLLNVLPFVSCEAMNEEGPQTYPKFNQHPEPARLPLAKARDSLLDHATSEVGGNQSSFGVPYRFAQGGVGDTSLPRKAGDCMVLK